MRLDNEKQDNMDEIRKNMEQTNKDLAQIKKEKADMEKSQANNTNAKNYLEAHKKEVGNVVGQKVKDIDHRYNAGGNLTKRCTGITKKGNQCNNYSVSGRCYLHSK